MREFLKQLQIPLGVATVIALVYLGYVVAARHMARQHLAERQQAAGPTEEQKSKFLGTYGGSAVKILQFYARDPEILDGQSTVICYGVVNAKSVRMDPAVADVYPALNRCVDAAPRHDTKYTLTADGNDGKTVTAEFTLAVKPDAGNRPRITKFEVTKHTVEQGRHYFTIAFAFENASSVRVDPPDMPALEDSAPFGQWVVAPQKTTTYTLTVMDKKGHKASKQLTVEVPGK
ncbi:MAG TPA: hypothetical protein VMB03_19400 [Bryobacteraceae bacterium]|nr:hypothetical protein [Bryobacteraceae bacterium]